MKNITKLIGINNKPFSGKDSLFKTHITLKLRLEHDESGDSGSDEPLWVGGLTDIDNEYDIIEHVWAEYPTAEETIAALDAMCLEILIKKGI